MSNLDMLEALQALAAELTLPVENLLTPDYLRRVLWEPPEDGGADAVAATLIRLGARPWQVQLTAPILSEAVAAHLHEKNGDLELAVRLYADAARHAPSLAERDHQMRQAARLHQVLHHRG